MTADLFAAARRHGQAVALREKQGGLWRQWTWTEFAEAARDRAGALAARGLRRGDHGNRQSDERGDDDVAHGASLPSVALAKEGESARV